MIPFQEVTFVIACQADPNTQRLVDWIDSFYTYTLDRITEIVTRVVTQWGLVAMS